MQTLFCIHMVGKALWYKNSHCCQLLLIIHSSVACDNIVVFMISILLMLVHTSNSGSLCSLLSDLLYRSCSASWNCSRMHNCMNHLARHWVLTAMLIRVWRFICSVFGFSRKCLTSAKHEHSTMTWVAVFLTCSHWHTDVLYSDMFVLLRNAARLLWSVQICMIRELSAFLKSLWILSSL